MPAEPRTTRIILALRVGLWRTVGGQIWILAAAQGPDRKSGIGFPQHPAYPTFTWSRWDCRWKRIWVNSSVCASYAPFTAFPRQLTHVLERLDRFANPGRTQRERPHRGDRRSHRTRAAARSDEETITQAFISANTRPSRGRQSTSLGTGDGDRRRG